MLKNLHLIGIDEISIDKKHQYLTLFLDPETGVIVFVGDGRGANAHEPFWKRLRHSQAAIQIVAMDMYPIYFSVVLTHLPRAHDCLRLISYHQNGQ